MLNGTQVGPYKIEDVQGWIKAGYVKMDDPAWYDGCKDWITVKEITRSMRSRLGTVGGHLFPLEAYDGDEPTFLSAAYKDSSFYEISQLNDAGYHIWYDEGIEASSEWPEEIANAVIDARISGFYLSPLHCLGQLPERDKSCSHEDKPFLAVHMEELLTLIAITDG